MKQCKGCQKLLSKDNFSKNKNNSDGLSFYCKDCAKIHKDLYMYKVDGKEHHEQVLIDIVKKHGLPVKGIDYNKVLNMRITLYDFPGVMRSLLIDLPIFLKKYNLTYEEYKFIVQQCKANKFWIEAKK